MGAGLLPDSLTAALRQTLREWHAANPMVPGVSLGVYRRGQRGVFSAGQARLGARPHIGPETQFKVGSITKPLTATALLHAVSDSGLATSNLVTDVLVDLPAPARAVLERTQVGQLLCHTAGLDDRPPSSYGHTEGSIRRYVEALSPADRLFDDAVTFSYSNTGYVIAGHLLEQLSRSSFREALRTQLLDPLGMSGTGFDPAPANLAAGHVVGPKGTVEPTDEALARAWDPCGASLFATVEDLLTFAALHLSDPAAPGTLSDAVASAREPQARLLGHDDCWSHVWSMPAWSPEQLLFHGGSAIGYNGLLLALPRFGAAIAILSNLQGYELMTLMQTTLLHLLADCEAVPEAEPAPVPLAPGSPEPPVVPSTYARWGERYDLAGDSTALTVSMLPTPRELQTYAHGGWTDAARPVSPGVYELETTGLRVTFFGASEVRPACMTLTAGARLLPLVRGVSDA